VGDKGVVNLAGKGGVLVGDKAFFGLVSD